MVESTHSSRAIDELLQHGERSAGVYGVLSYRELLVKPGALQQLGLGMGYVDHQEVSGVSAVERDDTEAGAEGDKSGKNRAYPLGLPRYAR